MSLKPRQYVEDNYTDGLTCALCGNPDLKVVHVNNYPDFVSCGSCGSAFVVEDEGSWIMYGKFTPDLPETREFALRQWTWLEAVRQRADDERSSIAEQTIERPATPSMEAPAASLEEESTDQETTPVDEIATEEAPPPPAEAEEQARPALDAIFQEAKEFKIPEDIPIHLDQAEEDIIVEDISPEEVDEVQLSRLEQVSSPTDDIFSEEIKEDQFAEHEAISEIALEEPELPVPDWLEEQPPEGTEEVLTDAAFSEPIPEEPQFPEGQSVPPFAGEIPESTIQAPEESILGVPEEEPSASAEPSEFLDLLRDASEPPPVSSPEGGGAPVLPVGDETTIELEEGIPGLEEIDEPIEEHLLPPWAREEISEDESSLVDEILAAPTPTITEPQPLEAELDQEQVPPSIEEPTLTEPQVEQPESIPVEAASRPAEEPEEGFRHRVVVKGDTITFPKNVCSHDLQTPVTLAAAVRGTLPDPSMPALRKPLTFKLPLCRDCERRAKASTEEERSAKVQAHIISGIVAAFLLILALVFRFARFDPNVFEGIMVLLIVVVLGYGIPATLLLNRASNYAPPYDAAYVLSTLRVVDDAGEGMTAFEWRNQGYAELFRQVNRKKAEGPTSKVEDTMVLTEPVHEEPILPEPEPETPQKGEETRITDQEFEDMIAEAQSPETEAEDTLEGDAIDKLDSLDDIFKQTQPPEDNTQESE